MTKQLGNLNEPIGEFAQKKSRFTGPVGELVLKKSVDLQSRKLESVTKPKNVGKNLVAITQTVIVVCDVWFC